MKNRELKRLNLVLHNGRVKTIDCIAPGQVILLEDRKTEESFGGWVDLDEIEFIPLTEEWLIKLGLIKNEDDEFKKYSIHLEDRSTDEYSRDVNKEDFGVWICDLYIREVRFVHELQNLFFSIFNEELELK